MRSPVHLISYFTFAVRYLNSLQMNRKQFVLNHFLTTLPPLPSELQVIRKCLLCKYVCMDPYMLHAFKDEQPFLFY